MKLLWFALLMMANCVANAENCNEMPWLDSVICESNKPVETAYLELLSVLQQMDINGTNTKAEITSLIISQNKFVNRRNTTCELKAQTALSKQDIMDCYHDFDEARVAKLRSMLRNLNH